MSTYISILRGINVSGHNMIKMDVVRQLYSELGFSDIQTFIQSGNVIFSSISSNTNQLEGAISKELHDNFGFDIPVLVLTPEELKTALNNNPFINDPIKDPAFMHLTFLSNLPDRSLIEKIPSNFFLPDEYFISGKTIYLYCPHGYGKTKLNNSFFENKLKLTATTRNLNTSNELLKLAEKISQ